MDIRMAFGLVIIALVIFGCTGTAPAEPQQNQTPPDAGQFCGGIAAIACPAGHECVLDGTYPDAGGVCVPAKCGGPQDIACPAGYDCALDRCGADESRCGPDSYGKCVKAEPAVPAPPAGYCETDADCMTGGCSGQLCLSKGQAEEGGITTCEWKDEYDCYVPNGCGCINNRCAWSAETQACVEKANAEPEKFRIAAGGQFNITLFSNPTTGYDWQAVIGDELVVEYIGSECIGCDGEDMLVGAGHEFNYIFRALAAGTTGIEMNYARPWEIAPPEGTKKYSVEVADEVIRKIAKVGEEFSITLYSNPSTGYTWSPLVDNSGVVEYVGSSSDNCANYAGVVGAGCDITYTFRAVKVGTGMIRLEYLRPWESVPPVEEKNYEVVAG